jgi:hypothetical protein
METSPGWHGDKYVNEDTTVAIGWQEIEGKSYYFSEDDGNVEVETTKQAVVASVSSVVVNDVQETVTTTAKEVVVEEQTAIEAEAAAVAEVQQIQPIVVEESVVAAPFAAMEEAEVAVVEEPVAEPVVEEVPAIEVFEAAPVVEQTPVIEVFDAAPVVETAELVQPEPIPVEQVVFEEPAPVEPVVEEPVVEEPAADPAPVEEDIYVPEEQPVEEIQQPAEEVYVEPAPVEDVYYEDPTNPYADLNQRIANAALGLVDTTDGLTCTVVVQMALANAGVENAMQLWPDQYVSYGYYTDDPQAGNLIYYDNGGRGVDHIAVYLGDNSAVHGNYLGETVIAEAEAPWIGTPQFIQVVE